jgi:uncharacterized protein (DUF58 family)
VVVLADVSSGVGQAGASSADLAVRGAAGATAAYLAARDRVGLISYGQLVNWATPGTGRRQLNRITGLLLTSGADGVRIVAVTRLPRAALPPGALILVLSPLLSLPWSRPCANSASAGTPCSSSTCSAPSPTPAGAAAAAAAWPN